MTEHFNKLTPAEDERLAMLAEDCAAAMVLLGAAQVTQLRKMLTQKE